MRRHDFLSLLTFLSTLAFTLVAIKLLAPKLIGRGATVTELLVVAGLMCVFAVWSRSRANRRQRRQLDQIRDSALW